MRPRTRRSFLLMSSSANNSRLCSTRLTSILSPDHFYVIRILEWQVLQLPPLLEYPCRQQAHWYGISRRLSRQHDHNSQDSPIPARANFRGWGGTTFPLPTNCLMAVLGAVCRFAVSHQENHTAIVLSEGHMTGPRGNLS